MKNLLLSLVLSLEVPSSSQLLFSTVNFQVDEALLWKTLPAWYIKNGNIALQAVL